MKKLFLFFLLFPVLFATAQKQFVIDPDAEVRAVSGGFSSIRVSSGIHLYLSKSNEEAIAVSGPEEKYREGIKTEITNGELHIFYSGEKLRLGKDLRMNVYVGYMTLAQLTASGASDITVAGVLELPLLNMQLSGASDFKGEVKIDELNVKLSGASDIRLTGNAKEVNIESSGASDVKAYGLSAENANVKVSGASDVNITVTKTISASASGASDVFYKGPAELKMKEANGSSSIARVN